MSQEVEARLERSFMVDDGRYSDFGDEDTYQFCRLLAQFADTMTFSHGKRWKDDLDWFWYAAGAWGQLVKIRSGGAPDLAEPTQAGIKMFRDLIGGPSEDAQIEELRNLGKQAAQTIVEGNN